MLFGGCRGSSLRHRRPQGDGRRCHDWSCASTVRLRSTQTSAGASAPLIGMEDLLLTLRSRPDGFCDVQAREIPATVLEAYQRSNSSAGQGRRGTNRAADSYSPRKSSTIPGRPGGVMRHQNGLGRLGARAGMRLADGPVVALGAPTAKFSRSTELSCARGPARDDSRNQAADSVALMRWTAATPVPKVLAALRMPMPAANAALICFSLFAGSRGRPSRLP